MSEHLLEKYRCDRNRRSLERLVEAHRPLVVSVCRQMLRDPHDLDDVVQETFLKLTGHVNSINGSLSAWLALTARTTSIDFIRRNIRERNRRYGLARAGEIQRPRLAIHEAMRLRLRDAMLALEPGVRELLIERFVRKTPLGVLAIRLKYSVPTASRRVAHAIRQLAQILREIGVAQADEQAVCSCVGDPAALCEADEPDSGSMRFSPNWRSAELTPLGAASEMKCVEGWTRPIRVGVLVSYESACTMGRNQLYVGTKWQVHSSTYFPGSGLQLVSVVEPGTIHRGIIESTARDYAILGGLIRADDLAGLQTLDVLVLGINYSMSAPIAQAINHAVRGGMGLLNEYWTASQLGTDECEAARELMLSSSSIYKYHMPGECGDPLPATVLSEHSLLPGLHAGERLMLRGCGPAYRLMPGACMLIAKEHVIPPEEHRMCGVGPLQMPCYALGNLGRGRVAVVHAWPHQWFAQHLSICVHEYFMNLIRWLAATSREVS